MIRRPPRSTQSRSSAASDVYKRQGAKRAVLGLEDDSAGRAGGRGEVLLEHVIGGLGAVSYTHLRAHETVLDLVCRLLLEKKNKLT